MVHRINITVAIPRINTDNNPSLSKSVHALTVGPYLGHGAENVLHWNLDVLCFYDNLNYTMTSSYF